MRILAAGLAGLLLSAGGAGPALAQSTTQPGQGPSQAAAIVQQIHDQAYGRCMSQGRMGQGPDLQANCSCAADVAVSLLSDPAKQAIADGTIQSFQGPMLKGDQVSQYVTLLKTCPNVGAYLHQQYCAADITNPHCQVLEKALQQAQ